MTHILVARWVNLIQFLRFIWALQVSLALVFFFKFDGETARHLGPHSFTHLCVIKKHAKFQRNNCFFIKASAFAFLNGFPSEKKILVWKMWCISKGVFKPMFSLVRTCGWVVKLVTFSPLIQFLFTTRRNKNDFQKNPFFLTTLNYCTTLINVYIC